MALELLINISDVTMFPTSGEMTLRNFEAAVIRELVLSTEEKSWFHFLDGQFVNLDIEPGNSKVLIVEFTRNDCTSSVLVTAVAYVKGAEATMSTLVRAIP